MKKKILIFSLLALWLYAGPIIAQENPGESETSTESPAIGVSPDRVDETTLAIDIPGGGAGEADGSLNVFSAWDFIRMILILGAVVAAIYVIVYMLRRKGGPRFQENRLIRILSTKVLSSGRSLFLVEIGQQVFLVGSADNGVGLVSEITDKETLDALHLQAESSEGGEPRRRFGEILGAVFGRVQGGKLATPSLTDPAAYIRQQRQRLKSM